MKKLLLLVFFYTGSLIAQTPTFVEIDGGTFIMGNNTTKKDERPAHKVTVDDFSMSETQITVAQYRNYCKNRGVNMPKAPSWGWKNDHPIVNIKWRDANNYCIWLKAVLNKNVKLPTEAQWEYAAKSGGKGKQTIHSGGKKLANLGWYTKNSAGSTQPVKKKKPNAFGIYDMNGNVWEWCMDWYAPDYYLKSGKKRNPENKTVGDKKNRVARGGSWDSDKTTCTTTHRKKYMPKSSFNDRGFRVVIIN